MYLRVAKFLTTKPYKWVPIEYECVVYFFTVQIITAKVVSLGISGENSSQESSSDSSPGSPSHHQHHHHHHHHPVVGPNHEAENLLPSVVSCLCLSVCVYVCLSVRPSVCVCVSVCLSVCLYMMCVSPNYSLS